MPYRNIFIANESVLKLKQNQLVVFNGEEYSFPIEDIRSIVIDNPYTKITAKLMASLGEQGVCVILCNDRHIPCCQLMPVGSYCRALKRIELQQAQSKPHLKRLWQKIVVGKIENQAKCLALNGADSSKLISISKSVQSGDATNREGYAANVYFRSLFGNDFRRDDESAVNAALNYGYAVLRSFIAKNIVAYGLEPSVGIHHKNQLNAFNLADDLIEPFRPVVDLAVSKHTDLADGFTTYHKAQLQKLLNSVCLVRGDKWSVAKAVELEVQSLISCYESADSSLLKLPELCETAYFNYE